MSEEFSTKAIVSRKMTECEVKRNTIKVTINNIEYYFVADFSQYISFVPVTLYNIKYRPQSLDPCIDITDDCLNIPPYDRRIDDIYQQIIANPIQENVFLHF